MVVLWPGSPAFGLDFDPHDRFYPAQNAEGDWLWADPYGQPCFITGIDVIKSIHMGAQVDLWEGTYTSANPEQEWADDVRELLVARGFNAIGRDSEWDTAIIEEGFASGTRHDWFDFVCNENGEPQTAPVIDDFRFRKYLNEGCGTPEQPCIPHLINLHTIPVMTSFWFNPDDPFKGPNVPDVWSQVFHRRSDMVAELVFAEKDPEKLDHLPIPCTPGDQINQNFRDDRWLVGVWLGEELFWGYKVVEGIGPQGKKGWLRSIISTPYDDCVPNGQQGNYQFAAEMQELYVQRAGDLEQAVVLWNETYGPGGTALPFGSEFDFSISSFVTDCDPTALMYQFDSADIRDEFPTRYEGIYAHLEPMTSCICVSSGGSDWRFDDREDVDFTPLIDDGDPVDLGYYLTIDDGQRFMEEVAREFYETMTTSIRTFDYPAENVLHHTILSDRFVDHGAQQPFGPVIHRIASQYCDVICVNLYANRGAVNSEASELASLYGSLYEPRPILISEFAYHADFAKGYDCCMWEENPGTGDWTPHPNCGPASGPCSQTVNYNYPEDFDQNTRATSYGYYMQAMAGARTEDCERFVNGIFWYNFFDHPFLSASGDNFEVTHINSGRYQQNTQNWGVYDPKIYEPYQTLLNKAQEVNCQVQRIRTGDAWNGDGCNLPIQPPCE